MTSTMPHMIGRIRAIYIAIQHRKRIGVRNEHRLLPASDIAELVPVQVLEVEPGQPRLRSDDLSGNLEELGVDGSAPHEEPASVILSGTLTEYFEWKVIRGWQAADPSAPEGNLSTAPTVPAKTE